MTGEAYDGRSSAIAFGSQQALQGIGVWRHLKDAAQPILHIRVSDGDGAGGVSRLYLHYDHRLLADRRGPPPALGFIVENREIRRALMTRANELPRLRHLAPARVSRAERGGGNATPHLADGRAIAAKLLIAADGRCLPLRSEAGINVTQWNYAQTGIICTVHHELPHEAWPTGISCRPVLRHATDGAGRRANRSSIVWTERNEIAAAM
jgi:2-octaprenyl-6-methoxyphenol hydroxylase